MSYLREVLSIAAEAKPGSVFQVTVLHDAWCSLLAGKGSCNCRPEYVVRSDKDTA